MKLDAPQLRGVKRLLHVASVEMTLTDVAIRGLRARASYLPDQKKVQVQVVAVLAGENRHAVRPRAVEVVDWPAGSGDEDAIKEHLRGVTRRYRAAVHARTWPALVNATPACFTAGADVAAGRVTRCAACSAWYCSVDRP